MEKRKIKDNVYDKYTGEKSVYELFWHGGDFEITNELPKDYEIHKNEHHEDHRFYTNRDLWERPVKLLNDGFIRLKTREETILAPSEEFYNAFYIEKSKLYSKFAALDENDTRQIIRFVNKYGLLGLYYFGYDRIEYMGSCEYESLDSFVDEDQFFIDFSYRELVSDFKTEVVKMRDLIKIYQWIKEDKTLMLRDYFFTHYGPQETIPPSSIEVGGSDKKWLNFFKNKARKDYVIGFSKNHIINQLSDYLPHVNPITAPGDDNSLFEQRYTCPTLHIALYFQFYKEITAGVTYETCKECNNYFPLSREKKEICGDTCSNRRFARHSRARKAIEKLDNSYKKKEIKLVEYRKEKKKHEEKLNR